MYWLQCDQNFTSCFCFPIPIPILGSQSDESWRKVGGTKRVSVHTGSDLKGCSKLSVKDNIGVSDKYKTFF